MFTLILQEGVAAEGHHSRKILRKVKGTLNLIPYWVGMVLHGKQTTALVSQEC